jgi:mono/diheme cytochrome c family protein
MMAIATFALFFAMSCYEQGPAGFSIRSSKSYEASLYKQQCVICHGPEGEGKVIENGVKVPSLRQGEFKFKTEDEIYNQITNGGNGMLPFRDILTDRERKLLAGLVHDKLRNNNKNP